MTTDRDDAAHERLDELVATLYQELRRVARGQKRRSGMPDTLDTTAVVHEAYLRLARSPADYSDDEHFLASATKAMRHLLVDHARKRLTGKRGGGRFAETLTEVGHPAARVAAQAEQLIDLDRALDELARSEPRLAQVIECQFFAGLSREESSLVLELSQRTLRREWARARAWLETRLGHRNDR
ncbi:MAG: RNA polymerase subunit sigma [Acidobacteria bacterium]|nr:MAG: RNA polymerase subunit sigma [Acidobacteriota bacterium]REK03832.1 MAG: RNA polymerase subunit sigma [Acidobacteriota bacterium]